MCPQFFVLSTLLTLVASVADVGLVLASSAATVDF